MAVFYILLLLPIIIQHVRIRGLHRDYQKKNTFALSCFFGILTVLIMLRHKTVGTDTKNYVHFFSRYSYMEWADLARESTEIGFKFFNKVISLITEDPQFFLAVAAIASSAMIYPTYKRLCVDTSLTIVLFCTMSTFIMMFSGLKQTLAYGIGMIAYEYTRKSRLLPFILAVAVAMTFHPSAFMLAFMYPVYHAQITKKWLYAIVPVMVLIFALNKPIFSSLAALLSRFTEYEGKISETGAYTMLILFAMFAVFSFLIPDEDNMDRETIGLRNFLLFALVLQMFAPLHTLAMRMNYYYIIFIPLLVPKIIQYRSKRWGRVALISRHVMVLFFLIYFFINAYSGINLRVFPYHFFWEELI